MKPNLPLSLRIVACVFMLFGIYAISVTITGLFDYKLFFDPQILALPAGFGLLRLSNAWRKLGILLTYIQIVSLVAFQLFLLYRLDYRQWEIGNYSNSLALEPSRIVAAILLLIAIAQVSVLHQSEIRELFRTPRAIVLARRHSAARSRYRGPIAIFAIIGLVLTQFAIREITKNQWKSIGTGKPLPTSSFDAAPKD